MERISRYSLNLDAIDMNYLPVTYSRNFNSTVPLWNFDPNTNDYFEFEIREKKAESKKECIQTTTCYICNIEVPILFLKEHHESKKHHINKRITETALDRLKKQLQNKEDVEIVDNVNNDTYFCSECISVVPLKEQKSHENLQSHKYLAHFDKVYEELFNIYANENTTKNTQDEKQVLNTDFNKSDSVKLDSEQNSSVPNLNDIQKICKESEVKELNRYSVQELKEIDVKDNSSDTSIKKLIEDKSVFVYKNKDQVTTESTLPTSNTSPVAVSDKDFSLFKEDDVNLDLNCVSVLDDGYLHCNVCFSTFDANCLKSHTLGARHKMNKISNVHYMMKENGNDLFCIICCNTLENSVKSAKQHCKGEKHTAAYRKILKENGIIVNQSGFYCEMCDKSIPKRNEFIHVFGYKQHKRQIDILNNTYCSVCDIFVPNNEINIHDNSVSHISKLELKKNNFLNGNAKSEPKITAEKEDISSNETSRPYFCKICQVNVPNSKKNIAMHNNGAPHKNKTQQLVNKEAEHSAPSPSLKSKSSKNDTYFCNICQISIINNHDSIILHNLEESHLKKFQISKGVIETPKESPESKTVEMKTAIMCQVCQVRIPNNENNISEHEKGKVHLKNYNLILEREGIVSNDNKYFCQTCNIYIYNPLKHIDEKYHKNMLKIKNMHEQIYEPNIKTQKLTHKKAKHFDHSDKQHVDKRNDTALNEKLPAQDLDVTVSNPIPIIVNQNSTVSDQIPSTSNHQHTVSDQYSPSSNNQNTVSDYNPLTFNDLHTISDQNPPKFNHQHSVSDQMSQKSNHSLLATSSKQQPRCSPF